MTTSGSVDFSVNRNDIIRAAMEECGAIGDGEEILSGDLNIGISRLNLLVKQWQGHSDFARGMKVWSRKRGTLFLQKDTHQYSMGPSGDHWTASYVRTTLSADEATSSTAMDVTSTTGMTVGDYIGVVLDDKSIHWTTISAIPSTVTLTDALPSAAASGNYVYTYTTKARRPISIIAVSRRTIDSDSEIQDDPMQTIDVHAYEAIPNKTDQGDPVSIYYEASLLNGTLYTDSEPANVDEQLYITYLSPIEDFDSATDTPDYPQEYYSALVYELAVRLTAPFQLTLKPELKMLRDEAVAMAQSLYPENTTEYFQPGLE